jgi:leader peptidase (prepilin peptidase) / N-methyltransferase
MNRRAATCAALGGATLFAATASHSGPAAVEAARVAVLGAALGALAYIDLAERRIPNRVVVPATVACAALLITEGIRAEQLVDGLAIVAVMLGIGLAWPPSFGMGDVKLALLVAVGLGGLATRALVVGLGLAAALGVILIVRHGRDAGARSLPLAPFVSAGVLAAVLI